jgi:hypothetical protein
MTASDLIESFIALVGDQSADVQLQVWDVLRSALGIEGYGLPRYRPVREHNLSFNPSTSTPRLLEIHRMGDQMEWDQQSGMHTRIMSAMQEFESVIKEREQEAATQMKDWPKSKKTAVLIRQVHIERVAYDYCVGLMITFARLRFRESIRDDLVAQLLNAHEQNRDLAMDLVAEQKKSRGLLRRLNELSISNPNRSAH